MKTIKTVVLVALITFSSQISAYANNPSDDLKSVSQQIEKLLKGSDTVINNDVIVNIKFKLNKNNEIIVISDDSNNYEISEFIETHLNLKPLSVDKDSNYRFFSIPVKFTPNKNY